MRDWKFYSLSALVHLAAWFAVVSLSPSLVPAIPQTTSSPIRIRIVTSVQRDPASVVVSEQNEPPKVVPRQVTESAATPTSQDKRDRPVEPGKSYGDLLPHVSDVGGESVEGLASGGRLADFGMPAVRAADEIKLNLDIPLVFRKTQTTGRAFGKIKLNPKTGGLTLVFLNGDPDFRAVLFDLLATQKSKWRELLIALGRQELPISLRFEVRQQPKPAVWDDTQIGLDTRKLVIQRTRYVWQQMDGSLPQKGMPLPDEYAKRAILHDKAHLRRLRQTPAFMSPLRNVEL